MKKDTIKRYIISSALTFLTGFALVLVGQADGITLESFRDGTLVGVLFVAVRAGLKMLLEAFLVWRGVEK